MPDQATPERRVTCEHGRPPSALCIVCDADDEDACDAEALHDQSDAFGLAQLLIEAMTAVRVDDTGGLVDALSPLVGVLVDVRSIDDGAGLVVTLGDGAEFQVSVVRSR